jgi:hypothetical protein
MDNTFYITNLKKLLEYVEKEDYTGYDIYDGLKITGSKLLLNNFYINTLFTQFFKIFPFNLRKFVGIKKTKMPKAMGLFLNTYCYLVQISKDKNEKENYLKKAESVKNWLIKNSLKNYSGSCWNFGFNYRFMFDSPTIVITAIISRGLFEYYKITGDEEVKKTLISVGEFILSDLHITKTERGICFSYTPHTKDCTYNASMLAAEVLAKVYSITLDNKYLEYINKAVEFTLSKQKDDGRWNYCINLELKKERHQIDFHQGYVLESLYDIIKYAPLEDKKFKDSLERGTKFYFENQFFPDGKSKWRIPKIYPVDIHNQSQGIITFSKLKMLDKDYLPFAGKIADWTINNMMDKSGFFYYQIHKTFKNNISYMRWSQAWMLLALATLTKEIEIK